MIKIPNFIKNTFLVLFAEYFYYGILFLIGILISRFWGEVEFGNYNLIFSIAQICILTLGSPFSIILRRDIAINEAVGRELLNKVINLRLITLLISLIAGIALITFVYKASSYLILSFILIVVYRGFDLLNDSFFIYYQANKKFKKYFFIKVALSFFLLAFFSFIIYYFPKNYNYGYLMLVIISAFIFFIQFILFNKKKIKIEQRSDITYKYILSESWPIIANSFFFQINSRINILMIGYICINADFLGVYSAPITVIAAITMVGNALALVLFPLLTEKFNKDLNKFKDLLYKVCAGLFALGIALFMIYHFFSPLLISIYKLNNINSISVFFYAGMSIPFIMTNTLLGYIFTITKNQKSALLISIINLFLTLFITYFLTSSYQIVGASQAYLITNIFYFLILFLSLKIIINKTFKARKL